MTDDVNQASPSDASTVEPRSAVAPDTLSPGNSSAEGSATSPGDAATVTTPDANTDDRCAIEKQPYDFDHCTVQIAIQLLPSDGDANGRMVVVGVRSHLDVPILRVTRSNELGVLPPLVTALLDELKAELPKREQAARDALEKKKAEKAQRKIVMASKSTRGKQGKATLATAPTSSDATAADNRPRPEAQVTTAPQQQKGLF